jgi:hypothetical protein
VGGGCGGCGGGAEGCSGYVVCGGGDAEVVVDVDAYLDGF